MLKRTNWPIVSRPVDDVAAAEEHHRRDRDGGQEEQRRQVRGLDPRLAHDGVAHHGRLAAEPRAHVVLAPERLHHLDADDGLVGGLGDVALCRLHCREIGMTRWANRQATNPISGVATAE